MQKTKSELADYWHGALSILENTFSEVTFDTWISELVPIDMDESTFILKAKSDICKSTVNHRYLVDITKSLRAVINSDIEVKIVAPEDFKSSEKNAKPSFQHNLRSKYVFETFVRGKSNELAFAASQAVAESPGRTTYNPLFLYGGVGLGKTHLMHSIGNFVVWQNASAKVLYVPTENFTNEFITSIREKRNQEFRDKYREIDVLLIDDIQFLVGKAETQEELFHTFNTLYNDNKQIVLTSDQPPKDMRELEERLTSRFAMGLTVDISMPDFETRIAILEKKAELEYLSIPSEVTKFIAKSIVSNIRDLEGALNKVALYARLSNIQIDMDLAERAIKDLISEQEKRDITVPLIQDMVAAYYNITRDDLINRRRTQNIAYPRQIAMYLTRKILDMSLPKIGDAFGGRDHSTVVHGCGKVESDLERDQNLRNIIFEIERRIMAE